MSEPDIAQSQSVDMNLTKFITVSITDIKRYISQAPNKYCLEVDPPPAELFKANIDIPGPILKTIVNKSITSSTVHQAYKEAVASPIIKKTNLEPSLSNFWPVSNLPFISKIIEKVVSRLTFSR